MRIHLAAWFILWSVIIGTHSHVLRADLYLHRIENFYQPIRELTLSPQLSYFYTSSNYNLAGSSEAAPGLSRYTRVLTDFSGAYAIDKYFTFFGRLSWLRNDVTSSTGGGGNRFGPGDQTVGLVLRLIQQREKHRKPHRTLDLQFQTDFPVYKNNQSNLPFAGEGSRDFTVSFFLGMPLVHTPQKKWNLQAGGGYTARSSGFSTLLQWNLALNYAPPSGSVSLYEVMFYGVRAQKQLSAINAGLGSLGSFITQSPSPSFMGIRGKVEHSIGKDRVLFCALDRTFFGALAPVGFQIILGATRHFDFNPTRDAEGFLRETSSASLSAPPLLEQVADPFEARVTQASDRLNLIKIDQGSAGTVAVGQIFELFDFKKDSTTTPIAKAECVSVKKKQAVLKVTEYYKEVWIEKGFLVKRPLPE
jgi:hypothetical protein